MWTNPAAGLTTGQAARRLQVSPDTVKKWAARGYTGLDGEHHDLVVAGEFIRCGQVVKLYRYDSLLKAELATREHFNSRRPDRDEAFAA